MLAITLLTVWRKTVSSIHIIDHSHLSQAAIRGVLGMPSIFIQHPCSRVSNQGTSSKELHELPMEFQKVSEMGVKASRGKAALKDKGGEQTEEINQATELSGERGLLNGCISDRVLTKCLRKPNTKHRKL